MTQKFQQGGQLDQIFNAINSQPEQTLQLLVQSGVKPEDIIEIVQAGVLQGKIKPEIGEAILQAILGLKIVARHGIKLNYIKSLKNKCAEDEEVVYYKAGGSVTCGCKKKSGGEIEKAQKGTKAVDKFKNRKQDLASRDSIAINKYNDDELMLSRPGTWRKNKNFDPKDPNSRSHIWTPDRTKAPYNKKEVKKESNGSKIVKAFKDKCGSKMKKH